MILDCCKCNVTIKISLDGIGNDKAGFIKEVLEVYGWEADDKTGLPVCEHCVKEARAKLQNNRV